MNSFEKRQMRRCFAVIAWLIFIVGGFVLITGVVVGTPSSSAAEEQQQAGDIDESDSDAESDTSSPEQPDSEAADDAGDVPDHDATDDAGADETDGNTDSAVDEDQDPARGPPESDHDDRDADDEESNSEDDEPTSDSDSEHADVHLGESTDDTSFLHRAVSFLGIIGLLFCAFLLSNNRRRINWRLVSVGVGLQLAFAIFIFYVPGGQLIFDVATEAFTKLLDFTDAGSEFIFESHVTGEWEPGLRNFAFAVLPTIIFFSSLMTILYHLGIMQKLVDLFAKGMQKTMNLSGAESTSAAANIFVGQTEAPLVIKPFVKDMTMSELMVVMTGGFATVAGGVLAIYVGMLSDTFPNIAGHLIAASVMSAPAALVVAKIMYPETDEPKTMGKLEVDDIKEDVNVLDAASRGAAEGLKLALNVGAMLLAFIALIAMCNYLIGLPSLLYNEYLVLPELADYYERNGMTIPDGCAPGTVVDDEVYGCIQQMQAGASGAAEAWVAPMITMQDIFGWVFWPFAFMMGVPVEDCFVIASLLGEKMVINELVAYASLTELLAEGAIQNDRSIIIATYALCGFANFGSIGIQLGGIGGIAPSRKQDLAKIALKAMIGGTLAAFMTATIAGILI